MCVNFLVTDQIKQNLDYFSLNPKIYFVKYKKFNLSALFWRYNKQGCLYRAKLCVGGGGPVFHSTLLIFLLAFFSIKKYYKLVILKRVINTGAEIKVFCLYPSLKIQARYTDVNALREFHHRFFFFMRYSH